MNVDRQRFAIVGASSGIGLATAQLAAARGATVFMIARNPDRLASAACGVDGATAMAADVLDPDALGAVMSAIGTLDHLVVTAASDEKARIVPIGEASDAQLSASLDRLRGILNTVRAAAPHLGNHASVTLLCGASSVKPMPGGALLASESGAISALARALARDLAPVRANCVIAGVVDTPIHAEGRDDLAHWAEESLPARRFGQPGDIADAVLFAASNPYLTGSALTVDGGLTIT